MKRARKEKFICNYYEFSRKVIKEEYKRVYGKICLSQEELRNINKAIFLCTYRLDYSRKLGEIINSTISVIDGPEGVTTEAAAVKLAYFFNAAPPASVTVFWKKVREAMKFTLVVAASVLADKPVAEDIKKIFEQHENIKVEDAYDKLKQLWGSDLDIETWDDTEEAAFCFPCKPSMVIMALKSESENTNVALIKELLWSAVDGDYNEYGFNKNFKEALSIELLLMTLILNRALTEDEMIAVYRSVVLCVFLEYCAVGDVYDSLEDILYDRIQAAQYLSAVYFRSLLFPAHLGLFLAYEADAEFNDDLKRTLQDIINLANMVE